MDSCTANAPGHQLHGHGPDQRDAVHLHGDGHQHHRHGSRSSAPRPRSRRPANGPIHGYWMATSVGAVLTNGAAVSYGSPAGLALTAPIVALVPTPDRKGYWMVGADGGVFTYGDAALLRLDRCRCTSTSRSWAWPPRSDGKGYWLVAADGGVFAYGDAAFQGSLGGTRAQRPDRRHGRQRDRRLLAGRLPTAACSPTARPRSTARPAASTWSRRWSASRPLADGSGYYLVAADGGVFAYNAPFFGSAAGDRHRRGRRASPPGPAAATRWPPTSVGSTPTVPPTSATRSTPGRSTR